MITAKELAKRWKMHEGTLANWRSLNKGPKFVKIGRKVLYKERVIIKYESNVKG